MNEKLINLKKCVDDLEGVRIPWNVIKEYLVPLSKWLDEEFSRDRLSERDSNV